MVADSGTWSSSHFVLLDSARVGSDAGGAFLRLTSARKNLTGVVWSRTKQHVAVGFTTTFQIRMAAGAACSTLGNGMALVIQNDARGTTAEGGKGSALGFGGNSNSAIIPSLALEFDTYGNSADPDNHHIALQPNGTTDAASALAYATVTPLNDGSWHTVRMSYAPPTSGTPGLTVVVDGATIFNALAIDLGHVGSSSAQDANGYSWVGFTGATSSVCQSQDVRNWTLDDDLPPVFTSLPVVPPNLGFRNQLQLTLAAQDPDAGDYIKTLGVTVTPQPAASTPAFTGFVSGSNPASGTFSWTPALADTGSYTLTFTAADKWGKSVTSRAAIRVVDGIVRATVVPAAGQPASGYVVTVFNRLLGPFTRSGDPTSYAAALTNASGQAIVRGLPLSGEYCVTARPVGSIGSATGFGSFLAPQPVGGTAPAFAPGAGLGAVSVSATASTQLTPASFQAYCFDPGAGGGPAPFTLTAAASDVSSLLTLLPAGTLKVKFLDLNGNPTATPGWLVQPTATPPWASAFPVPPGVKRGLLLTNGPADASGYVTLPALPNDSVVVESGILSSPGQGALTFTLRLNGGSTSPVPPLVLEPLLCTLNKHGEAAGDAGSSIDFIGPIKDGYRASFGPPLRLRSDSLAIFYHQAGTGSATLYLRFLLNGSTYNLQARYSWDGTTGTLTGENGGAMAYGITATPYFAPATDNSGTVQLSWIISGVPSAVTAVSYALSSSGDQYPDASKDTTTSAFQSIPYPTSCTGGQSNDDQWWLM